jgi:hypothetical protein
LDGRFIVGGDFFLVNGTKVTNLVRLNPDGTVDPSFRADVTNAVLAVGIDSDGKVNLGLTASPGFLRLNSDGSPDRIDPVDTGPVHSLALMKNGQVLIHGNFKQVNGVDSPLIARLSLSSSVPRVEQVLALDKMVRVAVPTLPESIYTLEYALGPDAITWTPVDTVLGDGSKKVLTDHTATGPQRFYRIRR